MTNNKGFSLLELVLSIVIIGLCIIPIALSHQQAAAGSIQTKVLTVATALAEEKMEEAINAGFSGVSNTSLTSFSSPFTDYSYQVTVHYVDALDLDTSIDPATSDYKNIEVQVSHGILDQSVAVKSLLVDYTN
ncbi:MAG: type II secretion system GspH family protein [Candidatus Omnitrophica bacterium]|nr:type II secretion system GspH family protein [Candidatus Omnitrophota bacterium]